MSPATRVAVFRGEPSSKHGPKGQAACDRQVRFWNAQAAVEAVTRPLKYYSHTDSSDTRHWVPREKGIDVLIALSMVMGAMRDEYDAAVLSGTEERMGPLRFPGGLKPS